MKVQKIVSLDENTMRISQRMSNFSKWVRAGLRNYDQGIDITSELMLSHQQKAKWAKVSRILADTIVEHALELDENYQGNADELIVSAVKQVQKQSSLRDFE